METLITKTTRDGRALVIAYADGEFVATLNGAEFVRTRAPGHRQAKDIHVFGDKIGLTHAEGDILRAAYEARLRAAPVVVTRAALIAEYQGLCDEQAAAFERAHDRQDANAWHIKASYDAKIEAAAQAVRDYDAAHPEEAAAREAERAASVERNRWM